MRAIDLFDRGADRAPHRAAFVMEGRHHSYAEMRQLSHRIAAAMAARAGSLENRGFAVLSPNDPTAYGCVLGGLRAGAFWVPVNARNTVAHNAEYLGRVQPDWLFFHHSLAADADALHAQLPSVRHWICIDGDSALGPSLASFCDEGSGHAAPELAASDSRIATVFATGGTTGRSKGAVWTDRTWEAMAANWWSAMTCPTPPVHLMVAPMTHGAGVLTLLQMAQSATTVVMRRSDPGEILRLIEACRVTDIFLPPTIIYMMLADPALGRHDYSSLRHIAYGAAPMSVEKLKQAIDAFGPCMTQIYGQSEAPMICSCLPPWEHPVDDPAHAHRFGSAGRATLLTRLAIMDDDGRLLAPGERGEIVVRSPLVMKGYFGDPEGTDAVSSHGWHHTGDVGFLDAEGYLYVVDRKKDMIISGGFNLFPSEIEQVISALPEVRDCAVIGVPDPKWGEAVKAVIELRDGTALQAAEVIAACNSALGGVKTPKSVEFWDELPRSPNGKVLKRSIRDRFWNGLDRNI
ncbi:MAG: AMP-binding protein [Sneathiellaceae bacterium]